jgi:hypothetical protein
MHFMLSPSSELGHMPHYQFSIQFRDQPPSPLKAVELADESKAWATGKQVVELLVARLEGNPQLPSATLIVTDAWGLLVCELPFSDAAQPALRALGMLH